MRKIKLYIAMSLNGKIAGANGEVDWLDAIPNPDQLDYGYYSFLDTIDTTIMGYSTYAQLIGWKLPEDPYKGKENYVVTRKADVTDNPYNYKFINSNHIESIRELRNSLGKDIWLVGGGQLNTLLLNENLIDELLVFVMPYVVSKGIELFEAIPNAQHLKHLETKTYPTGVVELRYSCD